jgi:hypothetical protein
MTGTVDERNASSSKYFSNRNERNAMKDVVSNLQVQTEMSLCSVELPWSIPKGRTTCWVGRFNYQPFYPLLGKTILVLQRKGRKVEWRWRFMHLFYSALNGGECCALCPCRSITMEGNCPLPTVLRAQWVADSVWTQYKIEFPYLCKKCNKDPQDPERVA